MTDATIVDTDILIDLGRGISDAEICLQTLATRSELAISIITQMELIVGCANKRELQMLDRFLSQFQIIPIEPAISSQAVELLRLYRLSHGLLIPDSFIAATAMVLNFSFITKNQRDYRFIQGLNLLPYP